MNATLVGPCRTWTRWSKLMGILERCVGMQGKRNSLVVNRKGEREQTRDGV